MERKRKPAGARRTKDRLGLAGVIAASRRLGEQTTGEFPTMPQDSRDRKSGPEGEPDTAVVGSLVTIRLSKTDDEAVVYISQFETGVQGLAEDIQEKLPKGVLVQPLTPSITSSTESQPGGLADRICGRSVDDRIKLLNGKDAKIVAISFVGYQSKDDSDLVPTELA